MNGTGRNVGPRVQAIDIVANPMTPEIMAMRPDWARGFYTGKVKRAESASLGVTLDEMLRMMDAADIEVAFLIATRTGRLGLPGSWHLPYDVVAAAVEAHPTRFRGLAGVDPTQGMDAVRELERGITELGFVGAHSYPHWFELPPNHARYYPIYAKCVELGVPIQLQVGQSLIYTPEQRVRSVARPITLDDVACDFPELKLIGIHIGIPWETEMIAMAWKHENVFIACDAHSPKYWPPSFIQYLNSYGQDKVLFGTDFPVLGFERTRDEIEALGLKETVLPKLFRDNAAALYNLDLPG